MDIVQRVHWGATMMTLRLRSFPWRNLYLQHCTPSTLQSSWRLKSWIIVATTALIPTNRTKTTPEPTLVSPSCVTTETTVQRFETNLSSYELESYEDKSLAYFRDQFAQLLHSVRDEITNQHGVFVVGASRGSPNNFQFFNIFWRQAASWRHLSVYLQYVQFPFFLQKKYSETPISCRVTCCWSLRRATLISYQCRNVVDARQRTPARENVERDKINVVIAMSLSQCRALLNTA